MVECGKFEPISLKSERKINMSDSGLTGDQIALGMMMAEQMKINDFTAQARIRRFLKEANRHGGRHIYVVHVGKWVVESEVSVGVGLKSFWLGDKSEKYVFVKLHDGVKLEGMVAIKMYATSQNNHLQIVMDVWPVSETDKIFAGTIWMSEGFGRCEGSGSVSLFSVDRMTLDYPPFRFTGTVNGFLFGFVGFHELGFDSRAVVGNMMEQLRAELGEGDPKESLPLVVTPFGVSRGEVKSEYFVGGKLPDAKPELFTDGQFEVLQVVFSDGIKIVTEKSVEKKLLRAGVDEVTADKVLARLQKMAEVCWFTEVNYAGDLYYIPSSALISALRY